MTRSRRKIAKLGSPQKVDEGISKNNEGILETAINGKNGVIGEDRVDGVDKVRKRKSKEDASQSAGIGAMAPQETSDRSWEEGKRASGETEARKIHRLRFLKQSLYPVRCLAWEPTNKRLAVSRSEGSIELWSFHADPNRAINNCCWYLERRIPGAVNRTVETLVWCRCRLFATGTSGLLLEFDASFNVAREIPASAGGVVAMTANEKLGKIALASISGTIVVYDVTDEGLVYDRTLEKRKERIMSLAWHVDGETLVSGCRGFILIWDFASGRVKSDIALSKSLAKSKGNQGQRMHKACLVWTIEMFSDGTIVTGDSEGKLSVWDSVTATLKTQFDTHKGPILALCVADNEQAIWCAGVDPRVVEVKRNKDVLTGWQLGHVNKICTHDVHALAHVHFPGHTSKGIVFAGDDPRLTVTCVQKDESVHKRDQASGGIHTTNTRLPPTPAGVSSMISLSRKSGILVSRVNRGIEIWRLGSSSSPSSQPDSAILPLDSEPVKLALIPGRKSVNDYYSSAAINADASFVCLSDKTQTDVFKLSFPGVPSTDLIHPVSCIGKIKALHGILSPNILLSEFGSTSGDDVLVTVTADGRLEALRIHKKKSSHSDDVSTDESASFTFRKMTMNLSSVGLPKCMSLRTRRFDDDVEASFAAIGFTSGRVDLIDLLDGRVVASLPAREEIAVTAVAFSHDATEVAAVYANREVAFFHVDSQKTVYWPRSGEDLDEWRRMGKSVLPIQGLLYLSSTKLLMYSDRKVYTLERFVGGQNLEDDIQSSKDLEEDAQSVAKKNRLDADRPFKTIRSFQVVHFIDALENGELVVAETTMEKIEQALPEPLLRKKYGT